MILTDIKESILHLLFPHVCEGCGTDVLQQDHFLCLHCHASLPKTEFHLYPNNPVEKIFHGRLRIQNATAQYYFSKQSRMQHLMHSLKYKGNKDVGIYLGKLMGFALAETAHFQPIDALVPLPLFPSKEKRRGYNQATVLCEGIADVLHKPILTDVVIRTVHTDSQTAKNRVQRWQNMEGRFQLVKPEVIYGKHVLLVDDVITTGATLEACGAELLEAQNVQLSVATLCFSSR
ncbi:MAG TPA: phosphoribosyltransferase family protein [Flavisolibacter sp.]|nr:phosphoribosyltransferase family protein [Flavisolibacter sp.]